MISLLPIPGGFIPLANRCLSPCVVLPPSTRPSLLFCNTTNMEGFVCGWSYWFARAISIALQLVTIQELMTTWVAEEKYGYVWIAGFFIAIVLFNVLNVRRFGEIEYWMTVTKLATIVGIIILGFLVAMGVASETR